MRVLRSMLVMPANRADMLAKSPTYGADALVFDLEDSVPVAEKQKARELAREFIEKHKASNTIYVRVNSVQAGMLSADLEAIAVDGVVGVRLAKTESPEAVRTLDAMLTEYEGKRGLPQGSIEIQTSLESAKGVWLAHEIASASPRIRTVMCGTAQDGDLQADLGYKWTAEGNAVYYHRSRVMLAARAAGVEQVLDGSHPNFRDPQGLRIACEAARALGYRGKSVIHPSQIETVNEVFTPTAQELDYYRRVIEAFDAALARGSAATSVDGTMVDYAMVATSKQMLAWAESLGR